MHEIIDTTVQFIGPILFLTSLLIGIIRFRKLSRKTNAITFIGIIISLFCAWYWMGTGLSLKYNDSHWVKKKEGKYSTYSDIEVQERLNEIRRENRKTRALMTLYGLGYFISLSTALTMNLREKN